MNFTNKLPQTSLMLRTTPPSLPPRSRFVYFSTLWLFACCVCFVFSLAYHSPRSPQSRSSLFCPLRRALDGTSTQMRIIRIEYVYITGIQLETVPPVLSFCPPIARTYTKCKYDPDACTGEVEYQVVEPWAVKESR